MPWAYFLRFGICGYELQVPFRLEGRGFPGHFAAARISRTVFVQVVAGPSILCTFLGYFTPASEDTALYVQIGPLAMSHRRTQILATFTRGF
jgi:hypothetical protein